MDWNLILFFFFSGLVLGIACGLLGIIIGMVRK